MKPSLIVEACQRIRRKAYLYMYEVIAMQKDGKLQTSKNLRRSAADHQRSHQLNGTTEPSRVLQHMRPTETIWVMSWNPTSASARISVFVLAAFPRLRFSLCHIWFMVVVSFFCFLHNFLHFWTLFIGGGDNISSPTDITVLLHSRRTLHFFFPQSNTLRRAILFQRMATS